MFHPSKTRLRAVDDNRTMSNDTNNFTAVWPILTFADARASIAFLRDAFGFEEVAVYARDDDPSDVVHGELRWPLGGGVMVTSASGGDSPFHRPPGSALIYVVCDDPDGLHARATAAGAEVVRGLADEDYGSRGFSVRDPEGNVWSFGTYRGEG